MASGCGSATPSPRRAARGELAAELSRRTRTTEGLYTTIQSYDTLNRKVSVTDAWAPPPRPANDAFGNIVKVIDPNAAPATSTSTRSTVSPCRSTRGLRDRKHLQPSARRLKQSSMPTRRRELRETRKLIVTTARRFRHVPPARPSATSTPSRLRCPQPYTRITDAEGYHETFSFDRGQRHARRQERHTTTYEYDKNNRKVASICDYGAMEPVSRYSHQSLRYDAVATRPGLWRRRTARGAVTQYVYDKNNVWKQKIRK